MILLLTSIEQMIEQMIGKMIEQTVVVSSLMISYYYQNHFRNHFRGTHPLKISTVFVILVMFPEKREKLLDKCEYRTLFLHKNINNNRVTLVSMS